MFTYFNLSRLWKLAVIVWENYKSASFFFSSLSLSTAGWLLWVVQNRQAGMKHVWIMFIQFNWAVILLPGLCSRYALDGSRLIMRGMTGANFPVHGWMRRGCTGRETRSRPAHVRVRRRVYVRNDRSECAFARLKRNRFMCQKKCHLCFVFLFFLWALWD